MRFVKRKLNSLARAGSDQLNIGYVPTIDCAILMAAEDLGLYTKHGLSVRLTREVGWATIREKLLHEELDAAGAHASMAFAIYCGIGVVRRPCLTGLLLSVNGSAITLSNELWDAGVRDAITLGQYVRARRGTRKLAFGAVLELSSQNYNLRRWLVSGGIDPDKDVQITIIPSTLVYDSFREGFLDGYCVAEPWNSVAVQQKTGWVAAVSSEMNCNHPEKILLVLQEFAEKREDEHLRLIAALIEASRFCDNPANRPELARMLAKSRYLDVDESLLRNALLGNYDTGRTRRTVNDFVTFDALKVGAPTRAMAKRVYEMVETLGAEEQVRTLNPAVIGKVFREDIFNKAIQLYPTVARGDTPNRPVEPAPVADHEPAQGSKHGHSLSPNWASSAASFLETAGAPLCLQ